MNPPEESPQSFPTFALILIAFGILAGVAAPFAKNGPEFVSMFGSAAAFGISTWIIIRIIKYFSNPNRSSPGSPPDSDDR
jgi:hypothetical protein